MKLVINKQELDYKPDYSTGWKISAGDPFKFPVVIGDQSCFIKRFQNKRPENISGWQLLQKLKGRSELSLPKIFDIQQVIEKDNEISYVFYECLEGKTLEHMVKDHDSIDLKRLLYDIFNALEAIHRHGFWFADFCEKNIFCEKSGRYVLLDLDSAQPLSAHPANDMYGSKDYWIPVYRFYKDVINQPGIKLEDIHGMGLDYLQFIFLILHLKLFKESRRKNYKSDEDYKLLPSFLDKHDGNFQTLFIDVLRNGYDGLSAQSITEIRKLIEEKIINMNLTTGASKGAIIHEFSSNTNVVQKGGSFVLTWNVDADKIDLYRNGALFQTLGRSQQSLERTEFYDSDKDVTYELVAFKDGVQSKSKPVIIKCALPPSPSINPIIADHLLKTVPWVKFVAIAGIILSFLLLLIPMIFLLRFANKVKLGLASDNSNILNDAFKNIKYYFKSLGIIILIFLLIVLIILFSNMK